MKASTGGGDFELTPAGTHNARILSVVDIGEQAGTYEGKAYVRHQIIITWELVDTKMTDGRPFVVSNFYTLSFSPKANLRKDFKSMTGKDLTDEEYQQFEFTKLLKMPCQIVIMHETKNGKERAVPTAFIPFDKNNKPSDLTNNTVFFDTDNVDWDVFNALPDWQKKFIDQQKLGGASAAQSTQHDNSDDFDDDIPF